MSTPDIADLRRRIAVFEGRMQPGSHLELPDSPMKKHRLAAGHESPSRVLPFGITHFDSHFAAGGLSTNAIHEVMGSETRGAGTASGFAMAVAVGALKQRPGILLWTCDSFLRGEAGALNAEGLHQFGLDPAHMIIVNPNRDNDMLWVMEEAIASRAVKVVIGEFPRNHRKLSLTATRRLALKAQQQHTTVLLVRHGAQTVPSAARTRWLVKSMPSDPIGSFESGVGRSRWEIELIKNRDGRTGTFTLEWNHAECRFQDAAVSVGLAATPSNGQNRPSEMGQVVALRQAS